MSWDVAAKKTAEATGTGKFINLRDDGDRFVGVFLGEPATREVVFVGGRTEEFTDQHRAQGLRPRLTISLNVATYPDKQVKIYECGARVFKDILRVRDKYGLENWAFEVQRHGAKGDQDTTYSVMPEHQLTPTEKAEYARLQLHPLTTSAAPGDDNVPF